MILSKTLISTSYFRWFAPFVMQWLNENDDVSLEFLRNAYAKDKRDNVSICHVKIAKIIYYLFIYTKNLYETLVWCIKFLFLLQFQKNTEHANFSNSVVDVFTQLTQCFEVLQKLECQDPEIWKRYMKRFAKTVVKVLTEYSNVLQNDFHNHVRDEAKVKSNLNIID